MSTLTWEQIDNYHQRAKIEGGWLVKAYEDVVHDTTDRGLQPGWDFRMAMAFVPDSKHIWKL